MVNETSLLIPEPPLQVLPTLAKAIGLNEAIVTQQLHYLIRDHRNGKEIDGERWIYNTYEQWKEQYFPFWSIPTIQRIFANLEKHRVVISMQPEGTMSRRKYYRISRAGIANMTMERLAASPSYQVDTIQNISD